MGKGRRFKEKRKSNKIRIIILAIILTISIIMLGINLYCQKSIKNDEELQDILNDNSESQNIETSPDENTKTERMIMLEELQKENSDIIGWLEIPNSNISYPVLQGKDNNYYVNHNYKKEYSINGSLFLDKDYDWTLPSTNLLIHGHNNRGTNEMFCRSYKL